MRFERLKLHYGSMAIGYALSFALPLLAALIRAAVDPAGTIFPFVLFYPAIAAVGFFSGAVPGLAAILFSALSIPLLLRVEHPPALSWLALPIFGVVCAGAGAVLRSVRESAAEAARAILRFRLVTENAADWIFFLDAAGRIDYANRAACAGLGKNLKELIRRPLAAIVAEPYRAAFAELMDAARAGSPVRRESQLEGSSGELIPAEVSCTAISTSRDVVVHVAFRDLRERRETEKKLRDARHWEALGTLAGGLAHDFNNLLTAMMGNASLARELLPPGHETSGLLDNVIQAGSRSARLIEMMLAAAGYRRNFQLNIDPAPLLASAIAKITVPENVRIVTRTSPGLFSGEYSSLELLLFCLIENAVESYGPGGGTVEIETGLSAPSKLEPGDFEEGDSVGSECFRIVVEDHGSGIDTETLNRAFDPFFSTKFMGRGLGLAAVRGLVRAYNGKLWLRTRPGEGTRVEIRLRAGTKEPERPN